MPLSQRSNFSIVKFKDLPFSKKKKISSLYILIESHKFIASKAFINEYINNK